MADSPLLSIIITSNAIQRSRDILAVLDSVKEQTYPHLETVFIAERYRELEERVKAYGREKAIPNLKVVFNDGQPGLSSARNFGMKYARGDIFAFVDDDVVLFPEWAAETVKAFSDGSIIGVTGPAYPLWEDPRLSWFPEEFFWIISCTGWNGWREAREVRNAWGMNMAFTRKTFETAGPFSTRHGFPKGSFEGSIGEDNEYSRRAKEKTGGKIVFCPTAGVWHRVYPHRMSWRAIARRSYGLGRSRQRLKKFYGQTKGVLSTERGVLARIFTRLFPEIGKQLIPRPLTALRKLSVVVLSLSLLSTGYISGYLVKD